MSIRTLPRSPQSFPRSLALGAFLATALGGIPADATAAAQEEPQQPGLFPACVVVLPETEIRFELRPESGAFNLSSAAGRFTRKGSFIAPRQPGRYEIAATDSLSGRSLGGASVEVIPVEGALAPTKVQLQRGATYRFMAVTSAGPLTWMVKEPDRGTVTSEGIYTAPQRDGTFTLLVTSPWNPLLSLKAQVTVVDEQEGGTTGGGWQEGPAPTCVTRGVVINPMVVPVQAGHYQSLSAMVCVSDNQEVVWELVEGPREGNGGPIRGEIDATGVFHGSHPGIYLVKARSAAHPTLCGTAAILVAPSVTPVGQQPADLNREGYTATGLRDGSILLAGGWYGETFPSACWRFDPSIRAFTQASHLQVGRLGHKVVRLDDGRVLVAQGYGSQNHLGNPSERGPGFLAQGEVFDPAKGVWTQLPFSLPSLNLGGSAAPLPGGRALIAGGGRTPGSLAGHSVVVEPAKGAQRVGPKIGAWCTAIPLEDGHVLVTGGHEASDKGNERVKPSRASWRLDPKSLGFSPGLPMSQPRIQHTATLLADGRVLIAGGITGGRVVQEGVLPQQLLVTATTEVYDPKTGRFTPCGPMKWPRTGHAALLLPTGKVLVVGGWTSMGFLRGGTGPLRAHFFFPIESELFDPDNGTWSIMDTMSYGIDTPSLNLQVDGDVFISGRTVIQDLDAAHPELQKLVEGPSRSKVRVRFGPREPLAANEALAPK